MGESGMRDELEEALVLDAEKLFQLTGEVHLYDISELLEPEFDLEEEDAKDNQ